MRVWIGADVSEGYKEVLTHTKQLEDIMGYSSYQWVIIEYF